MKKINKYIISSLSLLLLGTSSIYGVNHVYLDINNGQETNDGKTPATAVRYIGTAINKLKSSGHTSEDCIVMCSTYSVGKDLSIDGKCGDWNATIVRNNGFTGDMFDIYGSHTGSYSSDGTGVMTIKNITISGRFLSDEASEVEGALINTVKIGSSDYLSNYYPRFDIILDDGAVLEDNHRSGAQTKFSGGAVFVHNATLTMKPGSRIQNCSSDYLGGAIFANNGNMYESIVNIDGGVISSCESVYYGGGICAYGTEDALESTLPVVLNLMSGQIEKCKVGGGKNSSIGRGGGVGVNYKVKVNLKGNNMKINDNYARRYGGGLHLAYKAELTFSAGQVYSNYTEMDKTDAYAYTSGAAGIHISNAALNMTGGLVHDNKTLGVGGGLHASYEGDIVISGGEFYNNEAGTQGGGINLNTGVGITIPEGTDFKMYNNKAARGGGIFVDGATIEIHSGEFTGNKALKLETTGDSDSYGYGGCFFATMENHVDEGRTYYPAKFYMYGGEVSGNQAQLSGGALFLHDKVEGYPCEGDPEVVIENGTISGNKALNGDGGAFYIEKGNMTFKNGTMTGNTSEGSGIEFGNGGAVYNKSGDITIINGAISGNTATARGGAFYIVGDLTFKNGAVESNTANNNGGGAYVYDGTVIFENGKLKSNTALNGGGIYLASGAQMTFTDGLIAKNKATALEGETIYTAFSAKSSVPNVNGCGGGIYLQSGSSTHTTSLTINVKNGFGLYGNTADRAGDDIVAEGVNTSVTVPNVTSMDLKDFEGKDAQPNWYEDYVYVEGGSDSGYSDHSILKYSGGSGKRFQQMLGSTDIDKHLVLFEESQKQYNDYVCLSLGYIVLTAKIQVTGLHEMENMYFVVEQNEIDLDGQYVLKKSYPVLIKGTSAKVDQRMVRNLMPGYYTVKQLQTGDTPWAWAYSVTNPVGGEYKYKELLEDGVSNVFEFTVKHVEDKTNVMHDEEIKINKMIEKK